MKSILILNGPNLNLLGQREVEIYGRESLEDLQSFTQLLLPEQTKLNWFQSNIEGELIGQIQKAANDDSIAGIVINPGGYAHTSVAILDALKILKKPVVEVHLSNVFKREQFRHNLLTAQGVDSVVSGVGKYAYYFGVLIILQVQRG